MRIVFITPAAGFRRLGPYRWGSKFYGQTNSITGPLILGGILKRAGHDVEVYEELNATVNIEKLLNKADIFAISIMTSNAPRGYELADYVHMHSDAEVLIGGIHANTCPEEAAKHADHVIVGEGEDIILDVVENRVSDRIIKCHPIENLDEVPFPDYSILKTPCKAANVMSTRGCPFRCAFCTTSRNFAPYRERSVENVIEEIRMYKKLGFKYINFEDDNFTANKKRAKEICRRMIAEGLVFKESFFFGRTDMANDEELLTLLHDAHLTRVLIGIESLNQNALDSIDKRQSIDNIKRAAKACKAHNIRLIASIVLGLDSDDEEDIDKAVDFAKSVDAYQLQPAVLTPYPGTPVYEKYKAEGRMLGFGWDKFDMMHVTFNPVHMTPWQLQQKFFDACKRFYDFKSIHVIREAFGIEYGFRRFGLAVAVRLSSGFLNMLSKKAKHSYMYKLRLQYDE